MNRLAILVFVIVGAWLAWTPCVEASGEKELTFGISYSIPPWVIRDQDAGIKLDIIRAALKGTAYSPVPFYLPYKRAYDLFQKGEIDAVLSPQKPVIEGGYLSKPVVVFQNYAISLKSKGFPFEIDLDFLTDKSVVAFHRARILLGERFGKMADANPDYSEEARQHLQVNLLFVREVDFLVMDKSVFGYYWRDAVEKGGTFREQFLKEVVFHPVFEPSEYSFLFLDEPARDVFDAGLDRIRESGEYDAIVQRNAAIFDLYRAPETDQ